MLFFKYSIFLVALISCKKEVSAIAVSNVLKAQDELVEASVGDTILYFDNALIYEIEDNGEKKEIWFFVNEETNQILFDPNDEMIHAIVSFPNGEYRMYGSGEFEDDIVITEKVPAVTENFIDENVLKSNKKIKSINQKNIQQLDIFCRGFTMKYTQMEGSETLFATTQIPINAWQIYGFSRLEGDALFPISLDYLNVFNKSQLITHVYNPQLTLKLLNYGPNPYEFVVKKYKKQK